MAYIEENRRVTCTRDVKASDKSAVCLRCALYNSFMISNTVIKAHNV